MMGNGGTGGTQVHEHLVVSYARFRYSVSHAQVSTVGITCSYFPRRPALVYRSASSGSAFSSTGTLHSFQVPVLFKCAALQDEASEVYVSLYRNSITTDWSWELKHGERFLFFCNANVPRVTKRGLNCSPI